MQCSALLPPISGTGVLPVKFACSPCVTVGFLVFQFIPLTVPKHAEFHWNYQVAHRYVCACALRWDGAPSWLIPHLVPVASGIGSESSAALNGIGCFRKWMGQNDWIWLLLIAAVVQYIYTQNVWVHDLHRILFGWALLSAHALGFVGIWRLDFSRCLTVSCKWFSFVSERTRVSGKYKSIIWL